MFESLQDGLKSAFKSLRGKGKLTEANMRDGLQLVEQSLLDADVSFDVVTGFHESRHGAVAGPKGAQLARPRPAGRRHRA